MPDAKMSIFSKSGAGVEIRSNQLGASGTLKVEKPGVKFMTTFKVMVVKTKFIVAK